MLGDLPGLVAGVGVADVLSGAAEVVSQRAQVAPVVVAVAGAGVVAQGDSGATAQVVIGVGGQVGAVEFPDVDGTVQCVVAGVG